MDDNGFNEILTDNLKSLNETNWGGFVNKLRNRLALNSKKLNRSIDLVFSHQVDDDECKTSAENKTKLQLKLIQLFIKNKEDDCEKMKKNLIHYEITSGMSEDGSLTKTYFKDLKTFWNRFKILFYFKTLGDKQSTHLTEQNFWRFLFDFASEVGIPLTEPKENQEVKQSKKQKKHEKKVQKNEEKEEKKEDREEKKREKEENKQKEEKKNNEENGEEQKKVKINKKTKM